MNEWKEKLAKLSSRGLSVEILDQLDPYFEPNDFKKMFEGIARYECVEMGKLYPMDFWVAYLPYSSKPLSEYQHFFDDANVFANSYPPQFGRENVMHHALLGGNVQVMGLLLSGPYKQEILKDFGGSEILHDAACWGHVDSLQFLMAGPLKRKLKTQDINNRTILHAAAENFYQDTFSFLLRNYPDEAKACWSMEEINGNTPDDFFQACNRLGAVRSDPLETCFNEYTQSISEGTLPDENACKLLKSFSIEWKYWLLEPGSTVNIPLLISNAHLLASSHPSLAKIIISLQEISTLIAFNATDRILTRTLFSELLLLAKKVTDKEKTLLSSFSSFITPPKTFRKSLKKCFYSISSEENPLSPDVLRVIHVIISDNERDEEENDLKNLDHILSGKLLATQSIAAFRPKASVTDGRTINESNYLQHFDYINSVFQSIPVTAETKRIMNEIFLPATKHLIEHREDIMSASLANREGLYELNPGGGTELPLHLNHGANEQEFLEALHRLLQDLIGAFYFCETAGQLPEFFNKLCHGFCYEARVRDTLEWAISFSEIKSFDDFMESVIADYSAYCKVMDNMTDEGLSFIEPALNFIISRYKNFPCKVHEIYAPNNEITRAGVEKYLTEVLSYSVSDLSVNQKCCTVS